MAGRVRGRVAGLLIACGVAAGITPPAAAQLEGLEPSPAVLALIEAEYLTEDERRAARVNHGLWTDEDLEASPALAAEAALIAGVPDAAVFTEHADAIPAVVAADAALARGEAERALRLLGDDDSPRGVRVRVLALDALGRFDEARAAADGLTRRLLNDAVREADAIAEAIEVLRLRIDLANPDGQPDRDAGADYRAMLSLLKTAREQLGPLSWRARVAEAELLADKGNRAQAGEAAIEALTLNPRCTRAMALLAHLAVGGFDFARADLLVEEMDRLAIPFGELSHAGAMVQARAALRRADSVFAREVLIEPGERFPSHLELLALRAAAAAADFDEDAFRSLRDQAERQAPNHPAVQHAAGQVLAEARQYERSGELLREAIARRPGWAEPWADLGLMLVQAGQDGEARERLETAVRLDPFNVRAENSLNLVTELATWATIESPNFIVRYRPGRDATLAREMIPVLEDIHARVTADPEDIAGGIGHEPPPTLIELMPDHRWFSVRITGVTQVHTMAAATGPVIAMESPQVGPGHTVGHYDWPRTLQHEYTHTVTLSRTNNRIPHWFTEAASVFTEDAPRDERTWRLLADALRSGSLFSLDQISIAFVRPQRPTDRAQAYAQGHWMYQFIVDRWGPRAPVNLMDRYAAGEREASAFEAELGLDRAAFSAAFEAWARDDLIAHGLLPPGDAPTLEEMIRAEQRTMTDEAAAAFRPDASFVSRWIEQYPDHPELLELSMTLVLQGVDGPRLEPEVVGLLEHVASVCITLDTPHRLLARHYLAAESGEEQRRAIPHLEFLDAREQNSAAYAIELANQYAAGSEYDAALGKATRATRIAPFDADAREFAARVALLVGDADAAETHLVALTEIEPDRQIHQRRLEAFRARQTTNP